MKYYIITNRVIIKNDSEHIDTTNDGASTNNLRFATFDSKIDDVNQYTLIPDKQVVANESYYFDILKTEDVGSERFFKELHADMLTAEGGDTLVYIHGFNVSWEEGINTLRDLETKIVNREDSKIKNLVLISWPSKASVLRYKSDYLDATITGVTIGRCFQMLCEFLHEAFTLNKSAEQQCAQNIHLLCHSMGNKVLEQMILKLMADGNRYHNVFEEVILAAADVDNNIFENPNAFNYLPNLCRRVHVYCNRNDMALKVSSKYENPFKRLGSDGPADLKLLPAHVYVVDCTGVVFKDASSLDDKLIQHGYFRAVEPVINDIYLVLQGVNDEDIQPRTKVSEIKYRLI